MAKIRPGAKVRVVKPEFFVRCGYPLTFTDELERVQRERLDAITTFLRSEGVALDTPGLLGFPPAISKVARVIAYESCKAKAWGGRERRIYTHLIPEYVRREFIVLDVRFVKTGVHEPARTYGTYDGYEHEPAYLGDEKTHRILRTTFHDLLPGKVLTDVLEIEAANVEEV